MQVMIYKSFVQLKTIEKIFKNQIKNNEKFKEYGYLKMQKTISKKLGKK